MSSPDISPSFLADMLRKGGIWRNFSGIETKEIMCRILEGLEDIGTEQKELLKDKIKASETLHWSPLGDGIAMPHLRLDASCGNSPGFLAILMPSEAASLPVAIPDGVPVRHFLFFVSPSAKMHIHITGQICAHLLRGSLKRLMEDQSPDEEFFRALNGPPKS